MKFKNVHRLLLIAQLIAVLVIAYMMSQAMVRLFSILGN